MGDNAGNCEIKVKMFLRLEGAEQIEAYSRNPGAYGLDGAWFELIRGIDPDDERTPSVGHEKTDEDGIVTFRNLKPGVYTVLPICCSRECVFAEGRRPNFTTVVFKDENPSEKRDVIYYIEPKIYA